MNYSVHTLILGSGAAGLNTALQLKSLGVDDILILTEGLDQGTSINTGSDKQTYYKLGMYGNTPDSPVQLAGTLFNGGCVHGDIALAEAALSVRGFYNLVNLGVPFPHDRHGQYIGYKTDHDPFCRATSCGPYTSREMCLKLIDAVKRADIPIMEQRTAVSLLTVKDRAAGAITLNENGEFEVFRAENVVFAVGGPGGLYKESVYPAVHTGAIGLALKAGALARNLPESQFGLSSVKFRWNVSGTYMQVLPRVISTAADGVSDEREFLPEHYAGAGEMNSMLFLKGYQWPFDTTKIPNGSSMIDILVYIETVIRKRRVFLDYRANCAGFSFDALSREAYEYLEKSNALFGTPLERLAKMNRPAIDLYADHGIDLSKEPLEVAVCAQHNNGGLAANDWWESENIKHLFPVGEVNGSHGVTRPGGSALNAGQAGAFRAAEYIAARYREYSLDETLFEQAATNELAFLNQYLTRNRNSNDWQAERLEFQARMTAHGAQIRGENVCTAAWSQYTRLLEQGTQWRGPNGKAEALRNLQLCLAHAVYLEAIAASIRQGVGSRGSALELYPDGVELPGIGWRYRMENREFRSQVQMTRFDNGEVKNYWEPCRPLPECNGWFENIWNDYREQKIYE
jgi:succinate dehydrogenase/fumarate reductase flavoprotein subunit